jgi:hypothetical protein
MNRRNFMKLSVSLLALDLSGCLTAHMYQDEYTSEKLSSVLISEDGKHLVAITEKHDYVFDNEPRLSAIIRGSLHRYASARFDSFHMTSGGKTSGTVIMTLKGLPSELEPQASDLGFKTDESKAWVLRLPLEGTVYKGRGLPVDPAYRLNRTYYVSVKQDASAAPTAGKILATPVTVAVDGALILFGVALLSLGHWED